MREYLLDANVIVRFFVQDDAKQSNAATVLLEKAELGEIVLHLDPFAIAETVYVLSARYHHPRTDVANALLALIQNAGIVTQDRDTVMDALHRFAAYNVDYADAWLAARSAHLRHPVASFDRDFDKFNDIKRFEPS